MTAQMITMPASDYRPSASRTIPKQPSVIRLSLDYQIEDWCRTLRCTEWTLREAVRAVGPGATAVRSWLRGRAAHAEFAC